MEELIKTQIFKENKYFVCLLKSLGLLKTQKNFEQLWFLTDFKKKKKVLFPFGQKNDPGKKRTK